MVDSVSPVVVIHGGAGTLSRSLITPEREAAYRAALQEIALAAQTLLAQGVAALDVVTEAVRRFEECPLFNAGKGAVYTADERHELDACVMRGSDLAVGAVAGVTRLRNPVLAAREILLAGGPVLLVQFLKAAQLPSGSQLDGGALTLTDSTQLKESVLRQLVREAVLLNSTAATA